MADRFHEEHDPLDDQAAALADHAIRLTGNPIDALAILFQAAAAVLITSFKADAAVSIFELAASEMADELGSLIGVGAVRQ